MGNGPIQSRGNSLILVISRGFSNPCIQFLLWYGLERFEITTDLIFIFNFASPSSLRGFVLQWRLVMAEWERCSGPEQQRTPQRALGCAGVKMRWGKGGHEWRVLRLKTTNLHLLHCTNILSFDLVGGFVETFFILPLLANHFAGKHGVQQTWKHSPPSGMSSSFSCNSETSGWFQGTNSNFLIVSPEGDADVWNLSAYCTDQEH